MRTGRSSGRFAGRAVLLACGIAALGACADRDATTPPPPVEPPAVPAGVTVLRCTATVAEPAMECLGEPEGGVQASASAGGGPSLDARIVGGQGFYVRLVSSGLTYASGVFSMFVTVQNLSNLPMATVDGTTRHPDGVRVFFAQDPIGVGGEVTVANPTGSAFFTAAGQEYFQYGGHLNNFDRIDFGSDGVLSPGEIALSRVWRFNVPAGVSTFSFLVYVSSQMPPGTLETRAPQVTSVTPATLVPGGTATLTGYNFSAVAEENTVRVGEGTAKVMSATPTQLQIAVPCVASGTVAVQVVRAAMGGVPVASTLRAQRRITLQVGQAAILARPEDVVRCNELPATGGAARYAVVVFNIEPNAQRSVSYDLAMHPHPSGLPTWLPARSLPPHAAAVDPHLQVLEQNRREGQRLQARFGNDARMRSSLATAPSAEPPLTRTFRLPYRMGADFCRTYATVTGRRVYYAGKVAIYEDVAARPGVSSIDNPELAGYYQQIGEQFNAEMEPLVRTHFGDPLLRDAATDNNGIVIALFSPALYRLGIAQAFVASCDLYPNDGAANAASNFGEYVYGHVPVAASGDFAYTPALWYAVIRNLVIHELKHLAAYAWRVENGVATWEQPWLEEGTARVAEELWVRNFVYGSVWKGNTGYGSASLLGWVYCDSRPTWPCTATNPRRPSEGMLRHFSALYGFLGAPWLHSVLGSSPYDEYGPAYPTVAWSLVRYATDRYAASEASFLQALTQSSVIGTDNLAARTGVPFAEVMGGWALALYTDDWPGITLSPTLQMRTWNLPQIYAGLRGDDTSLPPRPINAQALALSGFEDMGGSAYGGSMRYYELSGTHTQARALELMGLGYYGGVLDPSIRMAIARLQ